jgi:uncharacterized membrane protein
MSTATTHLVVLGLDNRDDVERVFDLTGDLARQQLLQLQDAAYAWRDDKVKGPHPPGRQPDRRRGTLLG